MAAGPLTEGGEPSGAWRASAASGTSRVFLIGITLT
jgi:hypothetical protein